MDILFELTAYHWLALGLILFGAVICKQVLPWLGVYRYR